MIDVGKVEQYRENNRIEAKRALGGLPQSIWETYSAFANTLGGVILLGVEEQPDKSFRTVNLPDPEGMAAEFWALVNDPRKASVNLLTEEDVRIETVNGHRIIVISVPRAERFEKPVFVDGDPVTGSYWRSGEGDHRCTAEQLEAMRRDASLKTQDMRLVRALGLPALTGPELTDFRRRLREHHPGHPWEELEDEAFLLKIGAAGTDTDGVKAPTAAGVLLFGKGEDIRLVYPNFRLTRSEDGGKALVWEGSVYGFYFDTAKRLASRLPADADVTAAAEEALANCLINADYHSRACVEIDLRADRIAVTNPGYFRIRVGDAVSGGNSDPRNASLMRIFNLIGVGKSAGGGIPGIFTVWRSRGWSEPVITQRVGPGRVTLTLPLEEKPVPGAKNTLKDRSAIRRAARKEQIIDYLTEHMTADAEELSELVGLRPSGVKRLLRELTAEGLVAARGRGRDRRYSMQA